VARRPTTLAHNSETR